MFYVKVKLFDNNGEMAYFGGVYVTDEEADVLTNEELIRRTIEGLNELESTYIARGWMTEDDRTLEIPISTVTWKRV